MSNIIEQYQKKFADVFSTRWAFAFWKGRVALYAVLKALGVAKGDEVVLPGYTCLMDVNPIKYLGAKPIYVDIEPDTFNMNVELLNQKLTKKTKVIIAQHTYGYPCNMDAIMNMAGQNGIPVIEDCCLAFGSRYKNRLVGTFGKAAYFSSQWNKFYSTGLGGMVLTDDEEIAERIEFLRAGEVCLPSGGENFMLWLLLAVNRLFVYPKTTAFAQTVFRYLSKKSIVIGSASTSEFRPEMPPDFFKAMGDVQARTGLRHLKNIDRNIEHRKKIARFYDRLLEEKGWPARKYDASIMEPVMVRYPVRIAEKNKALAEAAKAFIELGSWFECPLHPIETPLAPYDYKIGMCPQAEKASSEVVNLPLHLRADERTAERTVEFITRFTKVI